MSQGGLKVANAISLAQAKSKVILQTFGPPLFRKRLDQNNMFLKNLSASGRLRLCGPWNPGKNERRHLLTYGGKFSYPSGFKQMVPELYE